MAHLLRPCDSIPSSSSSPLKNELHGSPCGRHALAHLQNRQQANAGPAGAREKINGMAQIVPAHSPPKEQPQHDHVRDVLRDNAASNKGTVTRKSTRSRPPQATKNAADQPEGLTKGDAFPSPAPTSSNAVTLNSTNSPTLAAHLRRQFLLPCRCAVHRNNSLVKISSNCSKATSAAFLRQLHKKHGPQLVAPYLSRSAVKATNLSMNLLSYTTSTHKTDMRLHATFSKPVSGTATLPPITNAMETDNFEAWQDLPNKKARANGKDLAEATVTDEQRQLLAPAIRSLSGRARNAINQASHFSKLDQVVAVVQSRRRYYRRQHGQSTSFVRLFSCRLFHVRELKRIRPVPFLPDLTFSTPPA